MLDVEDICNTFLYISFLRFQNGKKIDYLPLLFVDELSNRVKDLVVSLYIQINVM